jgi:hypothetical protein
MLCAVATQPIRPQCVYGDKENILLLFFCPVCGQRKSGRYDQNEKKPKEKNKKTSFSHLNFPLFSPFFYHEKIR